MTGESNDDSTVPENSGPDAAGLGTNMARRLVGAWEPNTKQQAELATGITVSSRGMRRKHLQRVAADRWQSTPEINSIGLSAGGVGYHESWSIDVADGVPRFSIGGT